MTPRVTSVLADLVYETEWSDLPSSAREAARRTTGNAAALAIGASNHPAVQAVFDAFKPLDSPRCASLLGRRERAGLFVAPIMNGIAIHAEDFDDTHLPTVMHPGAPILPAALASAELSDAPGDEVVAAVALGIEIALRVGNGVCPEHFERGWTLTGTVGTLGAAVAAGKLLRLSRLQLENSLGLALSQASGVMAALGTMAKPFHPGKASANGLEAALLGLRGFRGPYLPLEGRHGFAAAVTRSPNFEKMLHEIGSQWELESNTFKPYACGVVAHAVIDAARDLRTRVAPEEIAKVNVAVSPVVLEIMGVRDPTNGLKSKFSVYHAFAIGFLDDAGGPGQFSDERACAPDVRRLRERVNVRPISAIGKGAAHVTVLTHTGVEFEAVISHATGSAEKPLGYPALLEKARSLAEPRLGERTEEFLRVAFSMDTTQSVDELFAASRPLSSTEIDDLR